jgi:beta-glucosidase
MPWKDQVASILEMWYPGQEGGWATGDVLLGRVNPSGRLPVTFPRRIEDAPPAGETYTEGIAVGYRWYDQQKLEPLFPFGHGLSYTSFEYSNLVVAGQEVTFTLRNTGKTRGSEVPQLYLGPKRSLAAFRRVELAPGATCRITIHIDQRAFSYWSTEKHDWVQLEGSRPVYVGASSRDIRLSGNCKL